MRSKPVGYVALAVATWIAHGAAFASDLNLVAEATQQYATCIATTAADRNVARTALPAVRVQNALAKCAALRQRLSDALDPRGAAEYFARIDRDIQSVALELAEKAAAGAP